MLKFSTEEERKAFELGTKYFKLYMEFCFAKYPYKLNVGGCVRFVRDFSFFLTDDTDTIPNKENLNFLEFCEKYDCK